MQRPTMPWHCVVILVFPVDVWCVAYRCQWRVEPVVVLQSTRRESRCPAEMSIDLDGCLGLEGDQQSVRTR